jgi:hypothetical protein
VIETDIVSRKLELMRDNDYLSFAAAAHLREIINLALSGSALGSGS